VKHLNVILLTARNLHSTLPPGLSARYRISRDKSAELIRLERRLAATWRR
jgi:hypothetical protein